VANLVLFQFFSQNLRFTRRDKDKLTKMDEKCLKACQLRNELTCAISWVVEWTLVMQKIEFAKTVAKDGTA
jgi:hypothetical protein